MSNQVDTRFIYVNLVQSDVIYDIVKKESGKEDEVHRQYVELDNQYTYTYPHILTLEELEKDKSLYMSFYIQYSSYENADDYIKDYMYIAPVHDIKKTVSFYSIGFYEVYNKDRQDTVIHFLQTNKNTNRSMPRHYPSLWDKDYANVLLPPRSHVYIYDQEDYKGKRLSFVNDTNFIKTFTWRPYMHKMKSYKWVTRVGQNDPLVVDNTPMFYPKYESSQLSLSPQKPFVNANINLPLYSLQKMDRQNTSHLNKVYKK